MRGDTHADERPKEGWVCVEKRGRKVALRHEVLRAVKILENQAQ
jgi:hypothetical protein